jgi:hypothetical protein
MSDYVRVSRLVWIAESTEESDCGTLSEGIVLLRNRVSTIQWATAGIGLKSYNGEHFLTLDGLVNRRRDEAYELEALIDHVASRFPGSYGVLYERADDFERPPGSGSFRVRVMARGVVQTRLDPFLSPCRPVIED